MKKILLSLVALAGFCGISYAGDGSKASPYTVDQVVEFGKDYTEKNVYVEGYIVGTIPTSAPMSYMEYTEFSAKDASNTNLVLGGSSAETDYNWCIPIKLPANLRDALSVQKNPDNIGHKVILQGDIMKYCAAPGMQELTGYEWVGEAPTPGGGGSSGGSTGGDTEDENTYLVSGLGDFIIENVVMPDALSYVWNWDAQYGAKASAYANNTRYVTDSYLISPALTISTETPSATFSQALNYLSGNNRADFVNIYVREGEGAWQAIEPSAWPAGSDWGFVDECVLDLTAYAGKTIQIAFRYQSTETVAPTWEVKRLKVGATASGGDTPSTPTDVWTVAEALSQMSNGFLGNAQVKGYITDIQEVSTSFGNATYSISDDTNASNSLLVYRGYGLNGEKFTSASELQLGAAVVVSGELVNFNGTFEFTTGSKIVTYEGGQGGGGTTPSEPTGESVTFDFTQPSTLGQGYSDEGEANMEVDLTGKTLTNGVVSISFDATADASTKPRLFYGSGGSAGWTMRFYKNNSVKVAVAEGYNLTGIEFNGNNIKGWTISDGAIASNIWTPSTTVSEVTFTKLAQGDNPAIKTMKVYYTDDSGVESVIVIDEADAVYYNLQGAKVLNPDKGIYIKVVNGKSSKVLVK